MGRFQIVPVVKHEETDGSRTIFTARGLNSTAKYVDITRYIGELSDGRKKWLTGLKKEDISFNRLLTPDEKELYIKQLEKDLKFLLTRYRKEEIDETNENFWSKKQVGQVVLHDSIHTMIFDTELVPEHVILKYGIISGSYDLIAPSLDAAQKISAPFYLTTLEEQSEKQYAPVNERLKAAAELDNFIETNTEESLLWLAWALSKETQGFSSTTSKGIIANQLIEYLDGKLVKGLAKKRCAEHLREVLQKWKVDRNDIIIEAIFNVALHYARIFFDSKDNVYYTSQNKTRLGNNIETSVLILKDPSNIDELKELRDEIKKDLFK